MTQHDVTRAGFKEDRQWSKQSSQFLPFRIAVRMTSCCFKISTAWDHCMTVDVPIKYIAMLDTSSFDIKTRNVFAL